MERPSLIRKKVKLVKADKYKVWHKSIVGGFVNGDNKETQEHLSNERQRLEKEHTVHDSDTYCSNDSTHVIAGSPPNIFPYNINEGDIDGMDTEAFSKLCKTLKRMTSEYTVCEDIYLLESEGAHDSESNCFKGKDIRQISLSIPFRCMTPTITHQVIGEGLTLPWLHVVM